MVNGIVADEVVEEVSGFGEGIWWTLGDRVKLHINAKRDMERCELFGIFTKESKACCKALTLISGDMLRACRCRELDIIAIVEPHKANQMSPKQAPVTLNMRGEIFPLSKSAA